MTLDSAIFALEGGHYEAALRPLLEEWGRTHDPSVAKAVTLVDAAAKPLPESWRTAKRSAMHALWLEHAGASNPPLGWLAATWSQGTLDQSVERLELIRRAPPDPRLMLGVSAALVSPPFHGLTSSVLLYDTLLQLLGAWGEPATLVQVRRSLLLPPWTGKQMKTVMTPLIEQLATRLERGARFAVNERLQRALTPLALSMPDLLPADDLTALQVVADALQERADPRGEVLSAQIALATGSSNKALVAARNSAQVKVAKGLRKVKGRAPVLDPEVRVVHDEAELEVLLHPEGKWRARELTVAFAMRGRDANRLAAHPGLGKLAKLTLVRPIESAELVHGLVAALERLPRSVTLEVQVPSAVEHSLSALALWLTAPFNRRRLVVASLDCTLVGAKLVCRSNLAEGRPDYVSLFASGALSPGTVVTIEREWLQEPRKSQVLAAAAKAQLIVVAR